MEQFEYRKKIYPKYTSHMTGYANLSEDDYVRWGEAAASYLNGWLPQNKQAQCLDVACGAGHLLHMLKTKGYSNLTGIDISPEQVATAKRIWGNVFEANVLDFLQQHPESFDLITGFDVIEHFTKNEVFEFLGGACRALRPGGILILQTINAESPFGLKVRYGDFTHELAFDVNGLERLLSITGFVNIKARECGPYVHGLKSLIRKILWNLIRQGIKVWNLAETGSPGSCVFTRVFDIKAENPKH
ncbi:MAG: class I SAM-dependent methyltransferase [Elusimicrobia bacterium]|nr:class I SAM-dependent methyltransferase [Elusimicrobiota bacterium]